MAASRTYNWYLPLRLEAKTIRPVSVIAVVGDRVGVAVAANVFAAVGTGVEDGGNVYAAVGTRVGAVVTTAVFVATGSGVEDGGRV